jgi:hypothetical protein
MAASAQKGGVRARCAAQASRNAAKGMAAVKSQGARGSAGGTGVGAQKVQGAARLLRMPLQRAACGARSHAAPPMSLQHSPAQGQAAQRSGSRQGVAAQQ